MKEPGFTFKNAEMLSIQNSDPLTDEWQKLSDLVISSNLPKLGPAYTCTSHMYMYQLST